MPCQLSFSRFNLFFFFSFIFFPYAISLPFYLLFLMISRSCFLNFPLIPFFFSSFLMAARQRSADAFIRIYSFVSDFFCSLLFFFSFCFLFFFFTLRPILTFLCYNGYYILYTIMLYTERRWAWGGGNSTNQFNQPTA